MTLLLLLLLPVHAGKYDPPPGFQGTLRPSLAEPVLRNLTVDDSESCGLLTDDTRRLRLVAEGFRFTLDETFRTDTDFDRTVTLVHDDQTWQAPTSSQLSIEKKGKRVKGSVLASFRDYGEMTVSVSFDLPRCED